MQNTFAHKSLAELLEVILSNTGESDEAMWYVLHERMEARLRGKFQDYEGNLWDAYEDVVDEFFLYLREDGRKVVSDSYMSLRRIEVREAFEGWLLTTWRNFLHTKAERENARGVRTDSDRAERMASCGSDPLEQLIASESLSDEQKTRIVAELIAYCDQVFLPRGRFIFLRGLLTILNKRQALPEEEMAEALGMTRINYRVTSHRQRENQRKFLERILGGEQLRLNAEHQLLAERIYTRFDHLYPTLLALYNDALMQLKQRAAITEMRLCHMKEDGTMLHESETMFAMGIRAFWNRMVQ